MDAVLKISRGGGKRDIRQKVWDYIEAENLANFPRPVHNRIPNFKGAAQACNSLQALPEFRCSTAVKVNPDRPQEQARYLTLDAGKTLLVPTPRLRTGLFNKIVPPQGASKADLHVCSTSQGVKEYSVPIGLDAKVEVDLVVVGSVAVSPKGYRIGKGEGYADMEYAMMVAMGAVKPSTTVVTVVHDCQVVDISEELIESHDLTVDYILTPTRVIKTDCTLSKPQGIIWAKLDADMLDKIPILKKLRELERKSGKDVSLKKSPEEGETGGGSRNHLTSDPSQQTEKARVTERGAAGQTPVTTIYLGNIPAGVRVSELKCALRERDAVPLRLSWQGAQRRAFLDYADRAEAGRALAALRNLALNGRSVNPELARSQSANRKPELRAAAGISDKPPEGRGQRHDPQGVW
ncbi:methenyltetrahydrofolate synthase domain-containing protein isoform X2 [Denticeps clupeoides]|nr:methenyltetrahydrofolate synthase domain-containing protein isoform X2 [Denticeps clupeoides]